MKRRSFCALVPVLAAPCGLFGKPPRGPHWTALFTAHSLAGWHPQDSSRPNTWRPARTVTVDPANPKRLLASTEPGDTWLNNPDGKVANIVTDSTYGDLELSIEFMVPSGSNSGIYLQGLYEIQVFDSYGVEHPKTSDCGAIYHRWIDNKPVGGSAPRINASLPPGQWQSFEVRFQAPRFDPQGRKTANARFLRVLQNGKLVQENVEVEGGTRSHMPIPEAPLNPLMLQGDHGPVAYRNLYVRPLPKQKH